MRAIHYQRGFDRSMRPQAAAVYDAAFGAKLVLAIPDGHQRRALLADTFQPQYALVGIEANRLAGLVGFNTAAGAFTGGLGWAALRRHLGPIGALRAALVLPLFGRRRRPGQLLLDGIAVAPGLRGHGIGTALLHEVMQLATAEGYTSIRLDVIDTNPGAQRLYTRLGFVPTAAHHFGLLRGLLGFGAATTMEFSVARR